MLKKIRILCSFLCFYVSNIQAYEFAIATMFKDEAPYLKEWVEYHLMVGAEHFWLYNNLSTDNWEEILDPYIEQGIVEVIDWPSKENQEVLSDNKFPFQLQAEAVKDALKQAKGKTKWLSFIDIDEFFLPKKNKTVVECLNTYFPDVSAVFINWQSFGTNKMYIPKGEPILSRLNARACKSHDKNKNGKSIWRPEEIDVDSVWWVHWAQLNKEGRYVNGNGEEMILDGHKARWKWEVFDEVMSLNHYFFRDEAFFYEKRLPLAERRFSEYSIETLWRLYKDFLNESDTSMIDFIKTMHPESYENYWKKYE